MTTINTLIEALEEKEQFFYANCKTVPGDILSIAKGNVVADCITVIRELTEGYCLRPISPPRGESMPQTVEACQAIMERDNELILEQKDEISKLKQKINNQKQTISQLYSYVPMEPANGEEDK